MMEDTISFCVVTSREGELVMIVIRPSTAELCVTFRNFLMICT